MTDYIPHRCKWSFDHLWEERIGLWGYAVNPASLLHVCSSTHYGNLYEDHLYLEL